MLTVLRTCKEFGLAALMLTMASGVCVAAPGAAISGVVRDAQGVAQMGAAVQVFAASSLVVATAFTDLYGRYKIPNLLPGKYEVRATAALFVPARRANLRLVKGTRATVNLTLTMLSNPAVWLPAERRKPDEPGDDWTWTLRSAANRPILRMLDDGELVVVPSDQPSHPGGTGANGSKVTVHDAMMTGDGSFGNGGPHEVVSLDRAAGNGADVVLRTAVAAPRALNGRGLSMDLDAGYERRTAFAGDSRMVVSYASHPEIEMVTSGSPAAGSAAGLEMARMASAEKMRLGDTVDLEAGATVYAVRTTGTATAAQPFLRVTVHPGEVWAVRYRLATSRDVQAFDDLDSVGSATPVAAIVGGRLRAESGTHQEIAVSRKLGAGFVQAAVYRDAITRSAIAGTGPIGAANGLAASASTGVVADTSTGAFELLSAGYTTRGVSLMVSEPIVRRVTPGMSPAIWGTLEYQTGAGLSAQNAMAASLAEVSAGLHAESAQAATVALKGRIQYSGTRLRVSYRWQPSHLVTPVAGYESLSDQAFLGFYVRQALRWGDRLPPGLEATVDVTNLLAQGYQPFLSADGRTLFLAQSPRTLQAGLSFTF